MLREWIKVKHEVPYNHIKVERNGLKLNDITYRNPSIDLSVIGDLCDGIDRKFIDNLETKIVYYDEEVTKARLDSWFSSNKLAMNDDVERVYAWPETKVLEAYGYHFHLEHDLSRESYLLQFYITSDLSRLIDLRIIEFESIDPDFVTMLDKGNGFIKIANTKKISI